MSDEAKNEEPSEDGDETKPEPVKRQEQGRTFGRKGAERQK